MLDGLRRYRSAQVKCPHRHVALFKRHIEKRCRIFGDALDLRIAYDAYDLPLRRLAHRKSEVPPDDILAGPEFLGHGLVDDGDVRRLLAVGRGENAPLPKRDLQGGEIVRAHHVEHHAWWRMSGLGLAAVKHKALVRAD